jgi:hypothetical protein
MSDSILFVPSGMIRKRNLPKNIEEEYLRCSSVCAGTSVLTLAFSVVTAVLGAFELNSNATF